MSLRNHGGRIASLSRHRQLLSVALAVALLAAGPGWSQESDSPPVRTEYTIQLGDELAVKFFYNPDLNEQVVVRPDGRIALQLIPETIAAGKTPAELGAELRGLYSQELDRPAITVMVRTFTAQRIYVGGEVDEPGEQELKGPLTVMQAIARAQGALPTARLKEVIVIRRTSEGDAVILPVDIAAFRKGIDMSQDIQLLPYDVVYLPRTRIANVNKWVDEYIRQNIPFSFGFRIEVQ
jgi:protein involved in polysaccharide export with SLBB domain